MSEAEDQFGGRRAVLKESDAVSKASSNLAAGKAPTHVNHKDGPVLEDSSDGQENTLKSSSTSDDPDVTPQPSPSPVRRSSPGVTGTGTEGFEEGCRLSLESLDATLKEFETDSSPADPVVDDRCPTVVEDSEATTVIEAAFSPLDSEDPIALVDDDDELDVVLDSAFYNLSTSASSSTASSSRDLPSDRARNDDDEDEEDDDDDDEDEDQAPLTIEEQNFLAAFDASPAGTLALKYATSHPIALINSTSASLTVSSLNSGQHNNASHQKNGCSSLPGPASSAASTGVVFASARNANNTNNNNNNNAANSSSNVTMTILTLPAQPSAAAPQGPVGGGGAAPISPTSSLPPNVSLGTPQGSAIAVLTCRPNSHPFQERRIPLTAEPIKIGRSVAKARPLNNNGIFDCKVLSRNHAKLWFENGAFYLQDTKSSNGTFVNNQRLSKGSEESLPREICSGDIIQFGVDVMEKTRRGTVTHGCIVACVRLYLPDGAEAKSRVTMPPIQTPPTDSLSSQPMQMQPPTVVTANELFQIKHFLVEALHREQMLETKLATLQNLVTTSMEESDKGWQALIQEDRLISRLAVLESQLAVQSKLLQTCSGKDGPSDENIQQEITALHDDKANYEETAKDSINKVVQDKLEAERRLSDAERALSNTEDECAHLQEALEKVKEELKQECEKHADLLKDQAEKDSQAEERERESDEEKRQQSAQVKSLEAEVAQLGAKNAQLLATVEELQADAECKANQIQLLIDKFGADSELFSENMKVDPKTTSSTGIVVIPTGSEAELKESKLAELEAATSLPVMQPTAGLNRYPASINGENPYRNEADADGQRYPNNRLESESKAVEDSTQRETPPSDDHSVVSPNRDKCGRNISRQPHVEPSSAETSPRPSVVTNIPQVPSDVVRCCLKAALDQVKAAVLRQENELVNQPAHILALIDRQMEAYLSSQDDLQMAKSPDSEADGKLVDILLEESKRRQVEAEEELIVLKGILDKEQLRTADLENKIEELKSRAPPVDKESENKQTIDSLKAELQLSKDAYQRLETENKDTKLRLESALTQSPCDVGDGPESAVRLRHSSAVGTALTPNAIFEPVACIDGAQNSSRDWEKRDANSSHLNASIDSFLMDHSLPCSDCSCANPSHQAEIIALRDQLSVLAEDSSALVLRSRAISMAALVPIGLLLLAILLAFYDFLASFTATNEGTFPTNTQDGGER